MKSSLNVSHHAQVRLAQRGISARHIELVLNYGKSIFKQGLTFYFIHKNDVLKNIPPKEHSAVRNLIVVESTSDEEIIVTAYKNERAVRKINKKTKYLIKN